MPLKISSELRRPQLHCLTRRAPRPVMSASLGHASNQPPRRTFLEDHFSPGFRTRLLLSHQRGRVLSPWPRPTVPKARGVAGVWFPGKRSSSPDWRPQWNRRTRHMVSKFLHPQVPSADAISTEELALAMVWLHLRHLPAPHHHIHLQLFVSKLKNPRKVYPSLNCQNSEQNPSGSGFLVKTHLYLG